MVAITMQNYHHLNSTLGKILVVTDSVHPKNCEHHDKKKLNERYQAEMIKK